MAEKHAVRDIALEQKLELTYSEVMMDLGSTYIEYSFSAGVVAVVNYRDLAELELVDGEYLPTPIPETQRAAIVALANQAGKPALSCTQQASTGVMHVKALNVAGEAWIGAEQLTTSEREFASLLAEVRPVNDAPSSNELQKLRFVSEFDTERRNKILDPWCVSAVSLRHRLFGRRQLATDLDFVGMDRHGQAVALVEMKYDKDSSDGVNELITKTQKAALLAFAADLSSSEPVPLFLCAYLRDTWQSKIYGLNHVAKTVINSTGVVNCSDGDRYRLLKKCAGDAYNGIELPTHIRTEINSDAKPEPMRTCRFFELNPNEAIRARFGWPAL